MENEQQTGVLESLFDRTTDYIETRVDLVKLKAIRKSSEVVSSLVSAIVLAVTFTFFLLLLTIALSLLIGECIGNASAGFFIMAAFYLIAGLIIYSRRSSWLKTPVINSIIKKIHS